MVSGSIEGRRGAVKERVVRWRSKGHTRPLLNLQDQETEIEREEDKASLNNSF